MPPRHGSPIMPPEAASRLALASGALPLFSGAKRMGEEDEIIIVGAGPVGLMLANLLGARGISCLLVDRRTELPRQSRAIGVTPPTLGLMESIGCADALIEQGVPIRDAVIWDGRGRLGRLTFRHLPHQYPMILSVPQRRTMLVLQERLRDWPCVRYRDGVEFEGVRSPGADPEVRLRDLRTGSQRTARPSLLIGCDGHRSAVRQAFGMPCAHKRYRASFSMADFEGGPSMGPTAHLFFTEKGAVESFPLPGGLRRWIVQTGEAQNRLDRAGLVDCVRDRTGVDLQAAESSDVSWFQPERQCCRRFAKGRVVLCGDAAHVMTPIGGQGMNTGFADAEHAAQMIARCRCGGSWETLCAVYDHRRQRAFRFAADRAALGMWIGTRRGVLSRFRSFVLSHCLLREPFVRPLARHFAMLSVPHGALNQADGVSMVGARDGGTR